MNESHRHNRRWWETPYIMHQFVRAMKRWESLIVCTFWGSYFANSLKCSHVAFLWRLYMAYFLTEMHKTVFTLHQTFILNYSTHSTIQSNSICTLDAFLFAFLFATDFVRKMSHFQIKKKKGFVHNIWTTLFQISIKSRVCLSYKWVLVCITKHFIFSIIIFI